MYFHFSANERSFWIEFEMTMTFLTIRKQRGFYYFIVGISHPKASRDPHVTPRIA
jgi:hypothetical protein